MMNRLTENRLYQILLIVTAAFVAKVAIVSDVAVNGDTGLYLYDAQQILMGQVQFVEYPTRSPVFEHLLAVAIALGNSPLASARMLMILISLALGAAVYVLARQVHSHSAGLTSMALFYFTPFTLVWGAWVKTEQAAALFTIAGFIVALHVIDRDSIPLWAVGAVGTLFATSYLIRRVAIVHIGAFAVFWLWYRHRRYKTARSSVAPAAGVVAVAAGVIALAFTLLTRGDIGLAWQVFDAHTLALFESGGQGSLGWIELKDATAITAESRDTLLATICQKCGVNTAVVFGQTAMVVLPVVVAGLAVARSGLRRLDTLVADWGIPFAVAVALAWKFTQDGLGGELAFTSLVFAATAVFVVWATRAVKLSDVWTPKLALPIVVILALTAGYLYRDRILYVSYFQDFMPFVAIVAGVAAVAWWRRNTVAGYRIAFVGILLLSGMVAGMHADPYQPGTDGLQTHWFTEDLVDEYGDDMDTRLPDGGRVFTAQPLYLIHSDVRPLHDLSRRYYLFRGWPNSGLADGLERDILTSINDGEAPYAINDTNMHEMTDESERIRTALNDQYCPVDAPLYEQTGGQLLVHESHDTDCN